MLFTSSWITDILIVFITVGFFLYKYSTRNFDYWKNKGVFYFKPVPFFGNFSDIALFKKQAGVWLRDFYRKTDKPYFGLYVFDEPYLVIRSPELIKLLLIKDFKYFPDRNVAAPKHNELISSMIFFTKGSKWQEIRAKITSLFTSGKLKNMYPILDGVADRLCTYIGQHLDQSVECKEVCAKYAIEVIAKSAFGINAYCFDDENAVFRVLGRKIFDFSWRNALVHSIYFLRPKWADTLRLNFMEKSVQDYFAKVFGDVMKKREETKIKSNDLIDLLIDLAHNQRFGEQRLVAQAVQFYFAGFETTSATISFGLYELCLNHEIQSKLRSEILEQSQKFGGITYESLKEMKYLDCCMCEILRKYPSLAFLDRVCVQNYKLPGTDLVIEKGQKIYVPALGLHYDKDFFPEPDKFIPERFIDKDVNSDGLCYMPFGEGPRKCIGERFGYLSSKLALAKIVSRFEVDKVADTPEVITFTPKSIALISVIGVPMKFKLFSRSI